MSSAVHAHRWVQVSIIASLSAPESATGSLRITWGQFPHPIKLQYLLSINERFL